MAKGMTIEEAKAKAKAAASTPDTEDNEDENEDDTEDDKPEQQIESAHAFGSCVPLGECVCAIPKAS